MLDQRPGHLGRMQHIHQHALAGFIGVGAAEFVGGLVDAAQKFAGEGQGIWGDEVAVDGEVGAG